MTTLNLKDRFTSHEVIQSQSDLMEKVRLSVGELAYSIDVWIGDGREKSLALTHLEEAVFWANAAIARETA